MYIRFILALLLFILISAIKAEVRTFPELNEYKVNVFSKISASQVLAGTWDGNLLEWQGGTWHKFSPALPAKMLLTKIVARSIKNIWVFYQKDDHYYKTEAWHFNGVKWVNVKLNQPSLLNTFSFLSDSTFFAGGDWGTFIYFNGKKYVNIATPVNSSPRMIKALSPTECIVVFSLRSGDYNKNIVYHFKSGSWQRVFDMPAKTIKLKIINQDSVLSFNTRGELTLNTLSGSQLLSQPKFDQLLSKTDGDHIFYTRGDSLFKNDYYQEIYAGKALPISIIMELGKYEQLFLQNRTIYYSGPKKLGVPLNKRLSIYIQDYGTMRGFLSSIAVYKNRDGEPELYMAGFETPNAFYSTKKHMLDINHKRNLIGSPIDPNTSWDSAVTFADMDNDGDQDAIMAALRGKCKVYENTGNDRFTNITEISHFELKGRINEIQAVDLNKDGWLDLVAGDETGKLSILKNKTFWHFENLKDVPGLPTKKIGAKTALADMNNDGLPDLFLFSWFAPLRYFENISDKDSIKFIERSSLSPQLTSRFDFFTQSISFADFDNDGLTDFLLLNRASPTKLFKNIDGQTFKDVSAPSGLNQSWLAYSAAWGDIDLDGWQDAYITTLGKNYICWNIKGETFLIDSLALPLNDLTYSVTGLLEDLDNDGDLELVTVNNYIGQSNILENGLNTGNYIGIELENRLGNTKAIGAQVKLYAINDCGISLAGYKEIRNHNGYNANIYPNAHFGVNKKNKYKAIVTFPDGTIIEKENLPIGQRTLITYPVSFETGFLYRLNNYMQKLFFSPRLKDYTINTTLFFFLLALSFLLIKKYTVWRNYHLLFFFFSATVVFVTTLMLIDPGTGSHIIYLAAYISVIIGLLLFMVLNRYIKISYEEIANDKLSDLLAQFRHSRSGLNNIDHLLFIINNPSNLGIDLEDEWAYFRDITLPNISAIYRLAIKLLKNKTPAYALKKSYLKLRNKKSLYVKSRTFFFGLFSAKVLPKENTIFIGNEFKTVKNLLKEVQTEVDKEFTIAVVPEINRVFQNYTLFKNVAINNRTNRENINVIIRKTDLAQVLENLLQNSVQAGAENIWITIEKDKGIFCNLIIRDNGQGLKKGDHENIFIEGYSTKGSSGLGLAHNKKLLKKWGGDISVSINQPTLGAEFTVQLKMV